MITAVRDIRFLSDHNSYFFTAATRTQPPACQRPIRSWSSGPRRRINPRKSAPFYRGSGKNLFLRWAVVSGSFPFEELDLIQHLYLGCGRVAIEGGVDVKNAIELAD